MAHIGKPVPVASDEDDGFMQYFADRKKVYPKAVYGRVRALKWVILGVCLAVYYFLPWLRWSRGEGQPDQALLLDIYDRKFYFFNLEFWPQDIVYLTGLLIMAALGLFLVTSLFGRVWCGFACPQTVWTDLFMWVERQLEGDRNARMRRDANPMNFDTAWRKIAKHAIWLGVAFWTGGAWIMYFLDAPTIVRRFWEGTAGAPVYAFTFLFTATTYLLAGWAREQVCTFMCPWPRFQSAMLDEQSLIVTYQGWRGETRAHLKAKLPEGAKRGDCIDCGGCVTACPMGIDIRDGSQLECTGCGLCVDACNLALKKVGHPGGLITWDSIESQAAKACGEHKPRHFFRARTVIYLSAISVAMTVMVIALTNRDTIGLSVQQDRAPLFVRLSDGTIRDGYMIKISNKTQQETVFDLTISGVDGAKMALAETHNAQSSVLHLPVGHDQVAGHRILLTAPDHGAASTPVTFTLRNTSTDEATTYQGVFLGPAGAQH